MKIVHRISFAPAPGQLERLRSLGISIDKPKSQLVPLVAFDIDESHSAWPSVEPLIDAWKMGDVVQSKFTASELKKATALQMVGAWYHGYPMPDDDFGFLEASYDLQEYCAECGIGLRQTSPLRMQGEPKWGNKHILQLNWIFDEIFVLPEVWEHVFKPFGVHCMPVMNHRTGKKLRTVVQLDIDALASTSLRLPENQPREVCARCSRTKYLPICRGFFPAFTKPPVQHALKTLESLGSGASAWRAIIVSSDLFSRITAQKLKGVRFVPLSPR